MSSISAGDLSIAVEGTEALERTNVASVASQVQFTLATVSSAVGFKANHEDYTVAGSHPLTSSQREIWFDQSIYERSSMYNIGGYVCIGGAIDPERRPVRF